MKFLDDRAACDEISASRTRRQERHDDLAGIRAEVVVIEPACAKTQVVVRCGAQDLACVFRERITAKPGEAVAGVSGEFAARPPSG